MLCFRWRWAFGSALLALAVVHCSSGDGPVAVDPVDAASADSPAPAIDGAPRRRRKMSGVRRKYA